VASKRLPRGSTEGSLRLRPGRRSALRLLLAVSGFVLAPGACAERGEDERLLRGYVVLGHEVRSFEPCEGGGDLWVVPNEALRSAAAGLTHEPYGRVFVELRGRLGPPPETGFGSEYAGQLTVLDLRRAAPAAESHGCAEDLTDVAFRAAGNEPFWHLSITRDAIRFTTPDGPEPVLPLRSPRGTGRGWTYETDTPGPPPHSLVLILEPAPCSDSMVGARYSWRARLALDGRTYTGCAWEGDAPS
jgi:putative lipoprotein